MENTKQYDRDLILQAIRDNQLTQVLGEVQNAHPADIADLLDELPTREALIVFGRLPVVIASEVLDETGSLVRKEVISEVPDEHLADIFDELPVDDAVEIGDHVKQVEYDFRLRCFFLTALMNGSHISITTASMPSSCLSFS